MFDSAYPPQQPPAVPVVAFYIGGDTPHDWSDEEIAAQPATYGLPIYVHDGVGGDAAAAAAEVIGWLEAHSWAPGAAVAIDTEATVEPAWIADFDAIVSVKGWPVIDYQSKGPVSSNPLTSGGRWIADWTGSPHQYPGAVATQYASADQTGQPWDLSLIDQSVQLQLLHASYTPPPKDPQLVTVQLPELQESNTGPAVRSLQVLLQSHGQGVGPSGADADFGPDTDAAVRAFQQSAGLTADGIAGPVTWTALLTS